MKNMKQVPLFMVFMIFMVTIRMSLAGAVTLRKELRQNSVKFIR